MAVFPSPTRKQKKGDSSIYATRIALRVGTEDFAPEDKFLDVRGRNAENKRVGLRK
jgi:hypothetical protein